MKKLKIKIKLCIAKLVYNTKKLYEIKKLPIYFVETYFKSKIRVMIINILTIEIIIYIGNNIIMYIVYQNIIYRYINMVTLVLSF